MSANRNAMTFKTDEGYVRLRWQDAAKAPVVLLMGDGDDVLAYGFEAEQFAAFAAVVSEMATQMRGDAPVVRDPDAWAAVAKAGRS